MSGMSAGSVHNVVEVSGMSAGSAHTVIVVLSGMSACRAHSVAGVSVVARGGVKIVIKFESSKFSAMLSCCAVVAAVSFIELSSSLLLNTAARASSQVGWDTTTGLLRSLHIFSSSFRVATAILLVLLLHFRNSKASLAFPW